MEHGDSGVDVADNHTGTRKAANTEKDNTSLRQVNDIHIQTTPPPPVIFKRTSCKDPCCYRGLSASCGSRVPDDRAPSARLSHSGASKLALYHVLSNSIVMTLDFESASG